MTTTIILLLTGFVTGALISWFFYRSVTKQKLAAQEARLDQQNLAAVQMLKQNNSLIHEKQELIAKLSKAESRNEFLEEKLATQKQELEEIGNKFRFEFRNMAQSIMEEKSQKFTQLNEEKMKAIVDPLKTEIGLFKQKVEETYDKESKERFSLAKEVENLVKMSQAVSQEANNLTSALKGNSKFQGDWGELILESLLEHSGLTKGREYFTQEFIRDNTGNVIKDESGKALQPDVTICYPDLRKVIIDSKVSLIAWDAFTAESDIDKQKQYLSEHIKSIRQHIDGLSRKNYPKYAQALDYVLLFIPIEPAFLEAVKQDANLWKHAYDKKILLVSPTNLFAVLKIIADLWKVERQNRNAIDIAEKAGLLYDKFVGFIGNMEDVGKKISDASDCYDAAFKQLSTGRGNIVSKIEELKKMGANASKQLPEKLLYTLE
jgi:DNA recombination protein RmuC